MNFDIEGARKEGYSDSEIAEYLASKSKFDYKGAIKENYTDTEIIQYLSSKKTPTVKQPEESKPKTEGPLSWSQVPGEALLNTPKSAYEFGKSIYEAISSPVTTVKSVGKVFVGVLSKITPGTPVPGEPGEEAEKYAEAVGRFLVDRYGGIENIKKTMAKDPVGFLADVASAFSGVGLAARGTQVGTVATKLASFTDPLSIAGKAAQTIATPIEGAAKGLVGLTTGRGHAVIEEAVKNTPEFRKAMRGATAGEEAVEMTRTGVHEIANERSALYRQRLQEIENLPNPPQMDITRSTQSFGETMRSFKVTPIVDRQGDIVGLDFSRSALMGNKKAQADFNNLLDLFKNAYNDRQFYSTPVGMDTFKRQINSLYSETSLGRAAVEKVFKETRQQLIDRVPGYADMVGDYEKTTKLITEMEKALGAKDKTSVDTALRKLNTAMREDIDFRRSLIGVIEEKSGKNISAVLSGLQMNPWSSGALRSAGATIGGLMSIMYGNELGVLLAGLASPRLVGETISLLAQGGKAFEKVKGLAPPPVREGAFQAGRIEELTGPALTPALE